MKDTAKPLKGIRIQILTLLARKQDLTVADMIDSLPDFSEKQIGDNCYQAKQDGLLSSRMDGITRKQAYSITEQGKARIKSEAAPVKESLAKPVVKENLTTQSVIVSPEKIAEIEAAIDAGQAENGRLRAALKESEQVRENHAKSLLDLECEKIELLRENSVLRESQSAGVTRIDELSAALEQEHDEAMRLKSENMALTTLNKSMPGFGAAYTKAKSTEQQVTVEQFMIRVPKRKPMVVKSFEKARQQAMSAAKSVGKAEVFAMVLVGHAMRGAVWEQS